MPSVDNPPPPTGPGFFRVMAAVLSAFIGIRRKQASDHDRSVIKPVHVIVAGLIGALLFIAILVTVVRIILANVG